MKKMKISSKKLILVEFFLSIIFLLNIFAFKVNNVYILIGVIALSILIVIYLLDYEKSRQRLKKDAILNAIILASILEISLYLFGIFSGFLSSPYSSKIIGIIKNTLPLLLIIYTSEKLRYVINQKGREDKKVLIYSCIVFIIIDFSINLLGYSFEDKKVFIEIICMLLLPSITKNIFLTYNTTKFGYEGSLIYRLITEVPIYVIPIIPNIDNYLLSIIYFLYPILVLSITKKTIGNTKPVESIETRKINKVPLIICIILITIMIILNSGIANLYAIAIGSGSMEKAIYKGDAVIVHKLKSEKIDSLSIGDVLVYEYQNKIVIHRIHDMKKINGKMQILTKGDNNEKVDTWYVDNSQIKGKVVFTLRYIGWPTVWLNDLLS